jgi:hypothetical protein
MKNDEALRQLISLLAKLSGMPADEIALDMDIKDDLGLDTDDGLDLVCSLEELGYDIPDDVNPLINDQESRANKVREVLEVMLKYAKEARHGRE